MTPERLSALPERAVIERVMHSVVQIVALQRGFLGNLSPAWTGSGTIVDARGLVLTNCHVANPHAMGMSAPAADVLAIAVTGRSDEPPALTYHAEIAVQSPEMDLAVLRIVSGLDGRTNTKLSLSAIEVGDSDSLELGDSLHIFGYPGIGGETVTFTSGAVSGFTKEQGVSDHRAWIKTDATIAGGNSGGTAVNLQGQLVGIPTQAAAGTGIQPVDARPVIDTNQDGRIDESDSPIAVGGFINGLRPINLAKPLLLKAGVASAGASADVHPTVPSPAPAQPKPSVPSPAPSVPRPSVPAGTGPKFSNLVFSTRVTADGRPVNPAAVLPSGSASLYAGLEYDGMQNGVAWSQAWAVDGNTVVTDQGKWDGGSRGRKTLQLKNPKGLPDGLYHLVVAVKNQVVSEGQVTVGRRADDTDTEVSGQVVDRATGQGIPGTLVIALRPGVRVQDFVQRQLKEMIFTSTQTSSDGRFTFPQQLPKGQAYGLVVVARGYQDLAIESALRIGANAPERAQISSIALVAD